MARARASCEGSKLHFWVRKVWKGDAKRDIRRVFQETFDVVHGDEGGGRGGDDDDGLVVPCEAKDLFRILGMCEWA